MQTPVKKYCLSDEVASKLQQQIASGKYKAGDQLPTEPELMELFGVGRSTIREAMRLLVNSRLLRVRQGLGTFVDLQHGTCIPWYERLQNAKGPDLQEVRQLLELKIAEKAALNRTQKDITQMTRFLKKRYEAAVNNEIAACITADIQFHISIAEATKNDILADLYKTIAAQIEKSFQEVFSDTSAFLNVHEAHADLLQNIIDKDPKKSWQCAAKITGQPVQ